MCAKKLTGLNLGDLLEDADFAYSNEMEFAFKKDADELKEVKIDEILANPYQPRKHFSVEKIDELAASLAEHGLLQPVVLLPKAMLDPILASKDMAHLVDVKDGARYYLVAGERRLRAAKQLGWERIKAVIAAIEPAKTQQLALVENIHRENLDAIELALAYESLMKEQKLSQDELASLVQKSRPSVTNTLRLLKLSEETKGLVQSGEISAGHARVIAGALGHEKELADAVVKKGLSVRECEALAARLCSKNDTKRKVVQANSDMQNLCSKLKQLGCIGRLNGHQITFDLSDKKTFEVLRKLLE